MLSVISQRTLRSVTPLSCKAFSVMATAGKPKHHHKECPPSERKTKRDLKKAEQQKTINYYKQLDEEAAKSGFEKPWNCRLSLIVERQPIVFGQPPEWYSKFEEVRAQRRVDKCMPPVNKMVEDFFNDKEEQLVKEDKDDLEMQKLHEASTSDITPADKANDRRSLIRNTPGFLYLLINKPSGWTFPSIEYNSEVYKTTRQALERMAAATYGKDLQLYYWGFPPCVHTANKYSPEVQKKKKAFGEKMFYYRAARLIGDVSLSPSAGKDYVWVSLKEIPEYIKDENLISLLNRVLE